MKFTTEVPLMGLVTKVKVRFNPFDAQSTNAKEMLKYVSSRTIRAQNAKYTIETELSDSRCAPEVTLTYTDKSSRSFNLAKSHMASVIRQIHEHNLDLEKRGVTLPLDVEN
eukprot:TRINITY_DN9800_c0_g1_i2.p1 TRINITY_DN9800_c0_g1~~TRINITY_DN9800_c0_g1_i2.p1  ORF type:complete len:111 (+),score=8.01 TRINITY_DN9800_c0_g1_i2:46-378(+)